LTYGTSGKQLAPSTFSKGLWLSRNIALEVSPSSHSNAEIAPPIEGLSSSRKLPDFNVSVVSLLISDISLTSGFSRTQLGWG